jgi:hypothetical protein
VNRSQAFRQFQYLTVPLSVPPEVARAAAEAAAALIPITKITASERTSSKHRPELSSQLHRSIGLSELDRCIKFENAVDTVRNCRCER